MVFVDLLMIVFFIYLSTEQNLFKLTVKFLFRKQIICGVPQVSILGAIVILAICQ